MANATSTRAVESDKPLVFSWGPNSYGQLANGTTEDVLVPTRLDSFPDNVRGVVGGGGHSLVIQGNGDVLACGWNTKGQLGIPDLTDPEVTQLHIVPFSQKHRVVSLAAGWDFTLACTDDGNAYSWGSNSFGQLGCLEIQKWTSSPCQTKLEIGSQVRHVAAGLRHSLALTAEGNLYSWGNGKKGQLGFLADGKAPTLVSRPTLVKLPEGAGTPVQIVCGAYHSAVLTAEGQVYVWGDNKHGQMTLPVSESKSVLLPRQVSPQAFPHSVTQIRSGWTHFLALSKNNELLSWGRNHYGQLGRDTTDVGHDSNPGTVSHSFPSITQLLCGSEHNMVFSEGRLYTWGWNEHGICGTGDEADVHRPRVVAQMDQYCVSLIGCGHGHSFVVASAR